MKAYCVCYFIWTVHVLIYFHVVEPPGVPVLLPWFHIEWVHFKKSKVEVLFLKSTSTLNHLCTHTWKSKSTTLTNTRVTVHLSAQPSHQAYFCWKLPATAHQYSLLLWCRAWSKALLSVIPKGTPIVSHSLVHHSSQAQFHRRVELHCPS